MLITLVNGDMKGRKPQGIIMAAVWNKAGHYIFALWFLLPSIFFFPCPVSGVADWMSTILPHMV